MSISYKKEQFSILKVFIIIISAIIIFDIVVSLILFTFYDDDDNIVSYADGFEISDYKVILDVLKDNKVNVSEKVNINWMEEYHHGIYKFIPQWLEYTPKDGRTVKRKSKIKNLSSPTDEYSIDFVNEKTRIKIGNPDNYVDLGNKEYVINYTYDMGKDPYKGYDEFIFHLYGDYWGTEIKNPTFEINMPKNIKGYKINFFTDKYRKNKVNDAVDYYVVGNTIYAKFNADKYYDLQLKEYCSHYIYIDDNSNCDPTYFDYYPLSKSLTVDIELPEGYFVGGSWNYGWISFIISIIVILLTILTIILWFKYGKNYKKTVETVEFYPPENFSSAEIGYINGEKSYKKLTLSLIIELASKGYIKIDTLDKDNDIEITNLLNKPKQLKSFEDFLPTRFIKVKKLLDIDVELSIDEIRVMKEVFKKSDTVTLKNDFEKFLEVKDSLVEKGYIDIIKDNEDDLYKDLDNQKKLYKELEEQYNKDMKLYLSKSKELVPLTDIEKIVYNRLFNNKNVVVLSKHKTFYKAFGEVGEYLKKNLDDVINDKKSYFMLAISVVITIIVITLSIVSYKYIEDLDPKLNFLYYLSFICIFINVFFTIFMRRKTKYGESIKARINGFKNYLITAKKDELETLIVENPKYYYDILPYTYVLSISKKWVNKFEDIPFERTDMGNFNYTSNSSYDMFYNDVYFPRASSGSGFGGGSSGCSSCGGGGSSGGGCSSCGGGGSW